MLYLISRKGWYSYKRHVPNFVKEFDPRQHIQVSLKTQCKKIAAKRATVLNDEVEQYWKSLMQANKKHTKASFDTLVKLSKQLGFTYMPTMRLLEGNIEDLISRIYSVGKSNRNPQVVKALLGHQDIAELKLSDALEDYWEYSRPTLLKKNKDQQRKWKNVRIKAVNNFIRWVEDKPITAITNLDMVAFRNGWLQRMEKENIKADTINKDFTHLKGIIDVVNIHQELDIDVQKIFKGISLKEEDSGTRRAYKTEFIQNEILKESNLQDLSDEARAILYVAIETGARPIEIVNLETQDIILDHSIPYIHIQPRKGYSLKTKSSQRKIPLIGKGLEVFNNYPNGFPSFNGNSEKASCTINKFLSDRILRPTSKHSLYSFRHSFQDRLTALEVPDRIQCQLMGHSFKSKGRIEYGSGASLEHLHDIISKMLICL